MIFFSANYNFNFIIKGNLFFLFGIILFFILFSILIYKYTIPKISKPKKFFLTFLRSAIFALIILLLFDATITTFSNYENKKFTYLYVDNSNSIVLKDSSKIFQKIYSFLNKLPDAKKESIKIFSFANNVREIKNLSSLNFNQQGTNFNSVYNHINKNKNEINNVVIISDGLLNQGQDPINNFEKLDIPIYTIGIGDTSTNRNVEINNINYSQFIYLNKDSEISVIILNKGYENKNINVKLYEEEKLISQKNDKLNSSGFNKITFTIKPNKTGEVKYKIEVNKFNDESNYSDNSKNFYINVLSNKIKVGLVSDAPSNDLTSIINSLMQEKNFELIKFIKINNFKTWIEPTSSSIDSVDVFFFANFPSKSTSTTEIEKFANQIKRGKPYFISISNYTDLEKLNYFSNSLPITIKSFSHESQKVQPELLQNEYISNFSQISSRSDIWNKLAPIDQLNFNFLLKSESKIIVNSQIRNVELNKPMIVLRNIGNEKSFLFNGYNFWYWQFQNAESNNNFFPNFIIEIVKWLNQSNNKKFFMVKTNKKNYSQNEEVEFYAELFDQSFNPVDTSKIKVKVINDNSEINLISEGNGIYTAKYISTSSGEILFEANNTYYKNRYEKLNGRFNVSNIPVEKIETKMNENYLKQISFLTNGKYFYIDNVNLLFDDLLNSKPIENVSIVKKDFELWNNKFLLFVLIILLSLEWFTRKKLGMI